MLLRHLQSTGAVVEVDVIEVHVVTLGGEEFNLRMDNASPTVSSLKREIEALQSTSVLLQQLFKNQNGVNEAAKCGASHL